MVYGKSKEGEIMNPDIIIINKPLPQQWDGYEDLVQNDGLALYYANPEYLKMVATVTKSDILLLGTVDKDGEWKIAIPLMVKEGKFGAVINSLPFFGSSPGIIRRNCYPQDQASLDIRGLMETCKFLGERALSMTLIESPFCDDTDYYRSYGSFTFETERIGMVTPIGYPERIMDICHTKTRNMIRKAEKFGVIITDQTRNNKMAIDILQEIHEENMGKIGAPVKPKEFFDWIRTNPPGMNIYFAWVGMEIAAGLITFRQGKWTEYFMPAIKPEFRDFAPLNLLIYRAMQDQANQGAKFWNWGASGSPSNPIEGVYRFKKRFGGSEKIYRYHTSIPGLENGPMGFTISDLQKEYPYYFVIPFDKLGEQV